VEESLPARVVDLDACGDRAAVLGDDRVVVVDATGRVIDAWPARDAWSVDLGAGGALAAVTYPGRVELVEVGRGRVATVRSERWSVPTVVVDEDEPAWFEVLDGSAARVAGGVRTVVDPAEVPTPPEAAPEPLPGWVPGAPILTLPDGRRAYGVAAATRGLALAVRTDHTVGSVDLPEGTEEVVVLGDHLLVRGPGGAARVPVVVDPRAPDLARFAQGGDLAGGWAWRVDGQLLRWETGGAAGDGTALGWPAPWGAVAVAGRRVAWSDEEGVRLGDVDSGALELRPLAHARDVAVAADGAVAALADGTLSTFAPGGAPGLRVPVSRSADALAVAPGGAQAALVAGRSVSLVDAGGVRWTFALPSDGLAVGFDGDAVVAVATRGVTRIVDGRASVVADPPGGRSWVTARVDGGRVAATDEGGAVVTVSPEGEARVAWPRERWDAAHGAFFAGAELVVPDGDTLLAVGPGGARAVLGAPAPLAVASGGGAVVVTRADGSLWWRSPDGAWSAGSTAVEVPAVAVHPTGIALGRADGRLELRGPTGEPVLVDVAPGAAITSVAWSPDGSEVAAAWWPGAGGRWRRDGAPVGDPDDDAESLAWLTDGRLFALGWNELRIWAGDRFVPARAARGPRGWLGGPIAACGEALVGGDGFAEEQVWSLAPGSSRARALARPGGYGPLACTAEAGLAFTDGAHVVTVALDGSGLRRVALPGTPTALAWDGADLLVLADRRALRVGPDGTVAPLGAPPWN
jgi:hypothetical protein